MRRTKQKLLYLLSLGLLALAIYLNFFYKEQDSIPTQPQLVKKN